MQLGLPMLNIIKFWGVPLNFLNRHINFINSRGQIRILLLIIMVLIINNITSILDRLQEICDKFSNPCFKCEPSDFFWRFRRLFQNIIALLLRSCRNLFDFGLHHLLNTFQRHSLHILCAWNSNFYTLCAISEIRRRIGPNRFNCVDGEVFTIFVGPRLF